MSFALIDGLNQASARPYRSQTLVLSLLFPVLFSPPNLRHTWTDRFVEGRG